MVRFMYVPPMIRIVVTTEPTFVRIEEDGGVPLGGVPKLIIVNNVVE